MRRPTRAALATVSVATAVSLAACSSQSSPVGSTGGPGSPGFAVSGQSTSAAPATAAAASPTVWSTEVAQQKYLEYVAPSNAVFDDLDVLLKNRSTDLDAFHAACGRAADADDQFQRDLAAGAWPVNAQQAVSALIAAVSTERSSFQQCATATPLAAALQVFATIKYAAPEAQTVRIVLGLPGTG